ncbi:Y-family DNA polymerase [Planctomicrobium piriforme]|uniref:DNA polymerase-4 n=1 Tax=Planctomicrobium piriforme TaxID=1576369 RepID=A0A1I3FGJ3_9PLAN|nr:hypothetical protein [Planctomicrobium piriforme]SFI10296.1 DNA polymerase-4 [Planctomicrobium piriforme]
MPLRVLFVDMNAYFASVEQQCRPELRGRPVAVVAVNVDTTSCIAVSYEAKALGVRRGTPVWQAKRCKSLVVVEARPDVYVRMHHRIRQAVDSCVPVKQVHSIDELSCRLDPRQTDPIAAVDLAQRVKQAIAQQCGTSLRCSIGLAPNRFLAKIASGMRKPDGLTVIRDEDLPQALHSLQLIDLPGIGKRMLPRLQRANVQTVADLCALSEREMQRIWQGVVGRRWWHWLRGHDLPELPTHRSTVGHSHVLPPELRTDQGAEAVLVRLIHKAAARLRQMDLSARRLEVYVSLTFREEGWSGSVGLGICRDTLTAIKAFYELWRTRPRGIRPTQVGVTFYDLVPNQNVSLPLFEDEQAKLRLAQTMDQLNTKFGSNSVYFGGIHFVRKAAPTRIAFTHIPEIEDEPDDARRTHG